MKLAYVGCLLALLNLATFAADQLDAIEVQMKKSWDSFQSVSYDSETVSESGSEQFSYKMNSTGNTLMSKKGDKWRMRMEGTSTTVQKLQGQPEQKTEATSISVSDGVTFYSYTESAGQKSATKSKIPAQQDYSGDSFFKQMKDHYDFAVLPDETVDGMACWAVEARPKQKELAASAMKFCISKEHGMMVLSEMKGGPGGTKMITKVKNMKVNPSIAEDKFVFTPPPGVMVVDSDVENAKAVQQAQAAPNAEPAPAQQEPAKKEEAAAAEPAKKEEPKQEEPKKEEKKKEKKPKIKVPGF